MIFRKSLKKSRESILKAFSFISGKSEISNLDLEAFEDSLIESDIDLDTIDCIIDKIKSNKSRDILAQDIRETIKGTLPEINKFTESKVTMIVGVNGTGKTTFCAKYAKYLNNSNKKVLIVAADTYRAAAYEQIKEWCDRYNIKCIANLSKKDPSSVIFDSLNSKDINFFDNIIIDSAGRLHNSINLMKELKKMSSVIQKFDYTYNNLISIDSTTGKNALNQIELFSEYVNINGVVLNKIDGTAKGGIAISIMKKHKIPISFLGGGENIEDISAFDIDLFLENFISDDEKN